MNSYLKNRILFLLLAAFFGVRADAQLSFFYDNEDYEPAAGVIQFHTDSSRRHDWNYFKQIEPELLSYPENDFNNSYKNRLVWIKIRFDRINNPATLRYLLIRNPHINYLSVWLLKKDSMFHSFAPTGDRYRFSSRPIRLSDFAFPLPADSLDQYSLVIMADKRNELVRLPIYFLSEKGLLDYSRNKDGWAGLFIGVGVFLFLFNFFLFINMRNRLYVYYALYILLGFLYIFSDMGLIFMYLFPDYPLFADFTRPISISLATPVYILFGMSLLETKKYLPGNYRWTKRILIVYVFLLLASLILASNTGPIRVVLSAISYVVINILMINNLVIAWKSLRLKVPYAIYFILASLILIILVFLFTLYLSGHIPDNFLNRNLMRIAITAEISILTLVLAHRFKSYKVSSEQLLRRVNDQQEQIFRSVTDYQEKELQRLSSLLHDSVGARLSTLRLNLESRGKDIEREQLIKNLTASIQEISHEVRSYSHDLSPSLLQQKGLEAALNQFLKNLMQDNRIQFQFEMIGEGDRLPFRYELLLYNLVQELIHNIIKHANATEVIIQLLREEQVVSLYVEDNGKGFDPEKIKEGLGLIQIKQLVKFVNGNLQIDTSDGNGCRVSIEFTILPDDSSQTDYNS